MINKYKEIHDKFIEAFVQYYDAHTKFIKRPSHYTASAVTKGTMKMQRLIREMRKNNIAMRKDLREDKRNQKLTRKKEK